MKSRVRCAVLLLSVLVAAMAATGAAQTGKKAPTINIRVKVTVLNPKGEPVSGAGVVLKQATVLTGRLSRQPYQVEEHTDSKGQVEVTGFAPGDVIVQVIASGYQTWGQTMPFKDADEVMTVKLAPPQGQVSIYKGGGGK